MKKLTPAEREAQALERAPLAALIQATREEAGLSRREFGELLGFAGTTVQGVEEATKSPSFEFLSAFAREFGKARDDLDVFLAMAGRVHPDVEALLRETPEAGPIIRMIAKQMAEDPDITAQIFQAMLANNMA